MSKSKPTVTVIGGPNGSGKSTLVDSLIAAGVRLGHFVNADAIAKGLSAQQPKSVVIRFVFVADVAAFEHAQLEVYKEREKTMKPSSDMQKRDSTDAQNPPKALEVQAAFRQGVGNAIRRHHAMGRAVPIMQDGKHVWLQPDGSVTAPKRKPRKDKKASA